MFHHPAITTTTTTSTTILSIVDAPVVFVPFRLLVIAMVVHTASTMPWNVFAAHRQRLQTTSCLYAAKRLVKLCSEFVISTYSLSCRITRANRIKENLKMMDHDMI